MASRCKQEVSYDLANTRQLSLPNPRDLHYREIKAHFNRKDALIHRGPVLQRGPHYHQFYALNCTFDPEDPLQCPAELETFPTNLQATQVEPLKHCSAVLVSFRGKWMSGLSGPEPLGRICECRLIAPECQ